MGHRYNLPSPAAPPRPAGHSLGGATATLAALDLRLCHPTARFTVYTFGQPRVGNRPFATEYDALLPEHWAVVCDQVGRHAEWSEAGRFGWTCSSSA